MRADRPSLPVSPVEDYVSIRSGHEGVVVLIPAAEQAKLGRRRKCFVEFERAIDYDFIRVDPAMIGEVPPDEDRGRLALIERTLGVVTLETVSLHYVGLAHVDRLGSPDSVLECVGTGVLHVCE